MPPQPYVIGDSSPFLKRVLIPFWVIRIIIMLLELVACGLLVAVIALQQDELESDFGGSTVNTAIAIVAVDMTLVVLCLVLDIVCIVKRSRRTLSPKFFLITNVVQTTIWVVFFILAMIGARTAGTIILGIVIFISFVGMLIYASVIYHRFRKGDLNPGAGADGYVKAANPAISHGFYAEDTAYASQAYATQVQPSAQKYPASPYSVGVTPVDNASYAATQYPKPTYYDAPVHGGQQQGYELESRNP
ncbi:hypothetical protein B0H65DRAFT_423277 [Neurospora tetraspora]|uniref:MARVEL domain-containing protein n=1 Tax=Neurospora tetraspora TaxID=94610 RepID=A0AAE0MT60_9PEZI|nr:hypothetical protein B0H65DRAFT_423277 [Neurospora tetraspora]